MSVGSVQIGFLKLGKQENKSNREAAEGTNKLRSGHKVIMIRLV